MSKTFLEQQLIIIIIIIIAYNDNDNNNDKLHLVTIIDTNIRNLISTNRILLICRKMLEL